MTNAPGSAASLLGAACGYIARGVGVGARIGSRAGRRRASRSQSFLRAVPRQRCRRPRPRVVASRRPGGRGRCHGRDISSGVAALPRFEPRGIPFRAWLWRICINVVNDELRRRQRASRFTGTMPAEGPTEESTPTRSRMWRPAPLVHGLVDRLPADHRAVITLRFGDDLSIAEVARAARTLARRGEATAAQGTRHASRSSRRRRRRCLRRTQQTNWSRACRGRRSSTSSVQSSRSPRPRWPPRSA